MLALRQGRSNALNDGNGVNQSSQRMKTIFKPNTVMIIIVFIWPNLREKKSANNKIGPLPRSSKLEQANNFVRSEVSVRSYQFVGHCTAVSIGCHSVWWNAVAANDENPSGGQCKLAAAVEHRRVQRNTEEARLTAMRARNKAVSDDLGLLS